MANGEILTTDVSDFISVLNENLPVTGGKEADFDAVELALATYPWGGAENILFLISDDLIVSNGSFPIRGGFGSPDGQPSGDLEGLSKHGRPDRQLAHVPHGRQHHHLDAHQPRRWRHPSLVHVRRPVSRLRHVQEHSNDRE